MSFYQTLKLILVDIFELSKDGFHIILGYFVFLLFARIFKIKLSSWKALFPTIIFSLLLEIVDFRDSIVFQMRYDFFDSIHDIMITNILPLITLLYLRFQENIRPNDDAS
jgi:hypothetical protein